MELAQSCIHSKGGTVVDVVSDCLPHSPNRSNEGWPSPAVPSGKSTAKPSTINTGALFCHICNKLGCPVSNTTAKKNTCIAAEAGSSVPSIATSSIASISSTPGIDIADVTGIAASIASQECNHQTHWVTMENLAKHKTYPSPVVPFLVNWQSLAI